MVIVGLILVVLLVYLTYLHIVDRKKLNYIATRVQDLKLHNEEDVEVMCSILKVIGKYNIVERY